MNFLASIWITVGILVEVFVLCVLFGIMYYFLPNYFRTRKTRDLILFFVFFNFLIFVTADLTLRFLARYGRPPVEIVLAERTILVSLLLGSLFLLLFINSRSRIKGDRGVIIFLFLVFALVIGAALAYPVFPLLLEAVRLLWFLLWGLLGLISFAGIFFIPKNQPGQKVLSFYTAASGLLFVSAYFLKGAFGPAFLLSWVFILFGSIGTALGEGIDPESSLAENPLNYFRTRLLFKVLFGFVLLIIILFGTTYILTVQKIKSAYLETAVSSYKQIAYNAALEISNMEKADPNKIYQVVSRIDFGPESSAYVVDSSGILMVKSSRLRMKAGEKPPVLLQKIGAGEFYDQNKTLMVGAYYPVKKFSLGLIIQQPAYQTYKGISRVETDLLLYVIAGIILTILLGFIFSMGLERPLRQMIRGTQAIASGDLSYRINTNSIDELGKLAEAYNKMTAELRETQNRLIMSEKMIALGNMAAGMAHEIRNPLVSLRTFTQLLSQKWEDQEFRDKFSAIVPREIERINRIAESLLKFGRPWQAEEKEVNISAVLEEVLLLFEPEMKKKNITLQTKFAEVPLFKGDAPQLVQAFTNIVKNAIEAMGERGGGELSIETEYIMALKLKKQHFSPNEMTWGHKIEEKPYIMVKIADTGGGIKRGGLRNLFDPFYTSKIYGTGMGLPITLRIIEDHRGAVKVKNHPDEGAAFIVYLPQEKPA